MKSALWLLCSMCLFTACSDDNDENPTLQTPSTFQLNTPAYAASLVELEKSESLPLTWSQPNYGFPAAVSYMLDISLTNKFTVSVSEAAADESGATVADYATIDETYKSARGSVDVAMLAKAICQLGGWQSEDEMPATVRVYARMGAEYIGTEKIYSNVISFNVVPYYVELKDAQPIMWYFVGDNFGDGSWGNNPGVSSFPLFISSEYEYDKSTGAGAITYLNYFGTEGWKIQPADFNWDYGFMSGGAACTAVYRNGEGDAGNIWCDPAGYYQVTIDTGTNTCTIEKKDITPTVYDQICIAGTFTGEGWPDVNMTPVNKVGENHVWCYTQTVEAGKVEQFKFKIAGSWDTNWGYGADDGEVNICGKGTNNGKNIGLPEGTWIIMFNDITGEFSIIAK